jgi:hypothetical protein
VAKQHLDYPDVDLLFEQVRGETVAQMSLKTFSTLSSLPNYVL